VTAYVGHLVLWARKNSSRVAHLVDGVSSTELEICKDAKILRLRYFNLVKLGVSGRANLAPGRKQHRVQSTIMTRAVVRDDR